MDVRRVPERRPSRLAHAQRDAIAWLALRRAAETAASQSCTQQPCTQVRPASRLKQNLNPANVAAQPASELRSIFAAGCKRVYPATACAAQAQAKRIALQLGWSANTVRCAAARLNNEQRRLHCGCIEAQTMLFVLLLACFASETHCRTAAWRRRARERLARRLGKAHAKRLPCQAG